MTNKKAGTNNKLCIYSQNEILVNSLKRYFEFVCNIKIVTEDEIDKDSEKVNNPQNPQDWVYPLFIKYVLCIILKLIIITKIMNIF